MCRSIKRLRTPEGPAPEIEIEEAARQFIRKISGMRHPSARNEAPFERAVADVAATAAELLEQLPPLKR